MEDSFICCICKYKGLSQFDLQTHIDYTHSNNTGPEKFIDIEVDKDGNIIPKANCHLPKHQIISQVSAASDNAEITKISESYKNHLKVFHHLVCPHCKFFTVNVETLKSHLKTKHEREEGINPTSPEYFKYRSIINDNDEMFQPPSLKPKKVRRNNNSAEIHNGLSLPSSVNVLKRKLQNKQGKTTKNQSAAKKAQIDKPTVANGHQIKQTYNPVKSNLHPMNHSLNSSEQTGVSVPILFPQYGSGQSDETHLKKKESTQNKNKIKEVQMPSSDTNKIITAMEPESQATGANQKTNSNPQSGSGQSDETHLKKKESTENKNKIKEVQMPSLDTNKIITALEPESQATGANQKTNSNPQSGSGQSDKTHLKKKESTENKNKIKEVQMPSLDANKIITALEPESQATGANQKTNSTTFKCLFCSKASR
jgi:hypothetical protein